ncbi:MAG: branched-chain amino acid ABC transporter permease [Gammaproteobacteria bacterium]|jgi:branched-chain amino acid transport system permease protein|nr:branched-chain amino acid ABC transporter permease [Gammaproteobacteria bacterium]
MNLENSATQTTDTRRKPMGMLSVRVLALLFVVFLAAPAVLGEFWVEVATEILILGLFAMSFNLIYGYMGQISFGHAAFFGLGAYATAMLFREFTGGTEEISYLQFFVSLAAGIPLAAFGALLVGYFCIRLTGIYFAILTLAFGELLFFVVFSWYSFTGGDDGIQRLLPPPLFRDPVMYYYLCFVIVIAAMAVMWRIVHSPFGYLLRAMRDNQERTRFLGINTRIYMLINFVIAGSFAGLAGALWGPFTRSVAPTLLGWQESGIAVFMTLLGGSAFFAGPMVGSIIYTFLHAWVTGFTQYWPLTIGAIILIIVLFSPGGLLGAIDAWRRIRTRQGSSGVADNTLVKEEPDS